MNLGSITGGGRRFLALFTAGSFLVSAAPAETEKYRLVWREDPATTVVVAWNQVGGGADAVVRYGEVDHGGDWERYPSLARAARAESFKGMENRFARLRGLKPSTAYYFVLVDGDGASVSPRMWFRTAPDAPEPFSFVVGGDSRNNREPRREANRLVARLRPLFVAFNGDFTNNNSAVSWQEWFDDWQLTRSADGRVYPLVPARGNHEKKDGDIHRLFDLANPRNYYALGFGGGLMRLYSLNSEIPTGGVQREWLLDDLRRHAAGTGFLIAGYHKPMRPVVKSKKEGTRVYQAWAEVFWRHRFELVVESDSHAMKRTRPVRPSTGEGSVEGFVADPRWGTTYIGEGCWGAPLRKADDLKPWTLAAGSFNGFDWIQVYPDRLEVRTVKVAGPAAAIPEVDDARPFDPPPGLSLWEPDSGAVLTLPRRGGREKRQPGQPGTATPGADAGVGAGAAEGAGAAAPGAAPCGSDAGARVAESPGGDDPPAWGWRWDRIETVAGTGEAGFSGDGGPATEAQVNNPFGVVLEPGGALFFCDTGNHRIRRVDPGDGTISTVAGSGRAGYAGDGGPALEADLNEPYEVRFDGAGNLFFVEMKNHLVRRVDARTGRISTVAGTGAAGYSGDGGPAVAAQMKRPHSIQFDPAGRLLVCDIGNHRIRSIDLGRGRIETFAGTGGRGRTPDGKAFAGAPLNGPRAIDTGPGGDLWLALREGNAVYRFDLGTGLAHRVAGTGKKGFTGHGGPARQADLSGPKGISLDAAGNVFLADTESHSVRLVDARTGRIHLLAGTGEKGDGPDGDPRQCRLARPHGVFAAPDGSVYVGDSEAHRVRRLFAAPE